MTTATFTGTIEIPKFTDNLKSVSLGKSLLWQANGVELQAHCDNLMIEHGRRICTLQMMADGFVVACVDVRFRTRSQMAECVQRAVVTGHFEPRCGTYRVL